MATKKRKTPDRRPRAPATTASSPVTIDGCTTTRTYDDGTVGVVNHVSESEARAYAKSVKEGT